MLGSGCGCGVKGFAFGGDLSHAFSFQDEAVGVVDEAVEDGVSDGGILRMGNLSPGIPAPFEKGASLALVDHPAAVLKPATPWSRSVGIPGRDQPETPVAIARNALFRL